MSDPSVEHGSAEGSSVPIALGRDGSDHVTPVSVHWAVWGAAPASAPSRRPDSDSTIGPCPPVPWYCSDPPVPLPGRHRSSPCDRQFRRCERPGTLHACQMLSRGADAATARAGADRADGRAHDREAHPGLRRDPDRQDASRRRAEMPSMPIDAAASASVRPSPCRPRLDRKRSPSVTISSSAARRPAKASPPGTRHHDRAGRRR